MSMMIDLTPAEEARIAVAARSEGVDPASLVKKIVTEHLPVVMMPPEDPTLALFAQWEQEDAQMTPEEIAEENRTWAEFKANINAERDRAGARRVF